MWPSQIVKPFSLGLRFAVTLLVTSVFVAAAAAQDTVRLGVKLGGQLEDPLLTSDGTQVGANRAELPFITRMPQFTGGPTVEFGLPWKSAVETGAILKHYRYIERNAGPGGHRNTEDSKINTVEVPFVLKRYVFDFQRIHPFLRIDTAFRLASFRTYRVVNKSLFVPASEGFVPDGNLINKWTHGLVLTGGTDIGFGSFRLSPELRYTLWSNEAFRDRDSQNNRESVTLSRLVSNRSTLEVFIGFTFALYR